MDAETLPILDLRGVPAPDHMLRALDAVERLAPGACLRLLTATRPEPLFERLRTRRLGYSIAESGDDGCTVTIWDEHDPTGS